MSSQPASTLSHHAQDAALSRSMASDLCSGPASLTGFRQIGAPAHVQATGGGPRAARSRGMAPQERVTLHCDADVLAAFRATGPLWQEKINEALVQWLSEHDLPPALPPAVLPTHVTAELASSVDMVNVMKAAIRQANIRRD